MNIIEPPERVTVYSDLLYNSENAKNEFLNKIQSNLNNIRVIEKSKDSTDTFPSSDASVYEYVRQYTQLPYCHEISNKPLASFPLVSFQVEQEWEGYIQEVNDKDSTFTALLLDITANQKYPTEEADFRQGDIDEYDRHFLCPGAVFRWIIGCERSISGTRRSVSKLTFRRLPKWNKDAIKRADKKAQRFKEEITWE